MLGFDRITFDPNVMAGRACIRDTRVLVSLLINLVADGMDRAEIIESHPYIEDEDIRQALQYAASLAEEKVDAAASLVIGRRYAILGRHGHFAAHRRIPARCGP
jgi:uncharacterized protein (DUF433 family)